jgi:uncharacterized protein YggE
MKALYSIVALFLFTGIASANVTVNGQGKVTYVPDTGYITAGVSSKGKTAQEAWDKNSEAVKKLFDALYALGIDAKDLQTSNLSIQPEYSHPKDQDPVLIGYIVSYDLKITVRKLDDMGNVLDSLVKSGANRNVGIAFGLANMDKLMDEARLKAISEARHKADLYATAAGAKLGRVIDISEGQPWHPQMVRLELDNMKAAAGALHLAQGQQELSVTVTVVYGL